MNQGTITASGASVVTSGRVQVGGLAASNFAATISNSDATGAVSGQASVGGLIGLQQTDGTISDSHATGDVTGTNTGSMDADLSDQVGGLVGSNVSGTIRTSYATGDVSSDYASAGGLVGKNSAAGTIDTSHAMGAVAGNYAVGGLVGLNDGGTIRASYATGDVGKVISGTSVCCFGGLVGYNDGRIDGSYATGNTDNVTGGNIGGLVGYNENAGTISASRHETGMVSGFQRIGGLVGQNRGTIQDSTAGGAVSGQDQIGGLVGRNHAGTISRSDASGAVSGQRWTGGLVGTNAAGADIISSHATGKVGDQFVLDAGGLGGAEQRWHDPGELRRGQGRWWSRRVGGI